MVNHLQRGFTLVEMLFVILLIAVISVTVGPILFESYESYLVAQKVFDADWQGFITLERMVNDIHAIRSANDITTAQSTQLVFISNSGTTIQYQLSGSSLLRNSQTLSNGIQSFNLSYLNASGTVTSTLSAIRYVSISVTLNKNNIITTFSTLCAVRGIK